MECWPIKRIDELCEVTSSKRIFVADNVTSGVPFYRGKEITEKYNGSIEVSTQFFISEEKFAEIERRFGAPTEGDLLLTSVGTLGFPYVVRSGESFYFKDGNITWFRKLDGIVSRFLYYWLISPSGRAELQKCTIGTSQPAFTIVLLKNMRICLPPIAEQQKIADVLSAFDDLIENNRRRIGLLEEAARLLYREWFVYFRFPGHEHVKITNGLPEGWEPRTLADVVNVVKEMVKPSDFADDDVHIGLEHIPRRSFTLSDWEPAEDLASGKTRFHEGDILFGKIRPYFHKVGFTLRAGLASSDAIVMRVKEEVDWPLVVCTTASDRFVAVASKTVREGSKMPRADWNVLKKYPVPRPSSTILQIFNENVIPITAQCKSLALQNRALEEARDLLLPRLMSGEIAV